MVIEEPENILDFPVLEGEAATLTIGKFYARLKQMIVNFGEELFIQDHSRQVTKGFPPAELFAVTNVESATRAIDIIVQQGEGTSKSPRSIDGTVVGTKDLAPYYRFAEILHEKGLVKNPDAGPDTPPNKQYIYKEPPIPFDPSGIWRNVENPKAADYPENSDARTACDDFNATYTSLLQKLQTAFTGQPDTISITRAMMAALKIKAKALMKIQLGNGMNAGPSFEYQPSGGSGPSPQGSSGATAGHPAPSKTRYLHLQEILAAAAGPSNPNHDGRGKFWEKPLAEFIALTIYDVKLIADPGANRGANSGLIKALRGVAPFDGSSYDRMPLGRDPVAPADIQFIQDWIDAGCPDDPMPGP